MIRTTLTDSQWRIIAPHCLGRDCDPGRIGPDPRRFVEAVLRIAWTGCQWRNLPEAFGKWKTVVTRFRRWVTADAFYRMLKVLAVFSDFDYTMIDGTIVTVHRSGQSAKGGLKARPLAAHVAE